eukprot:c11306_g2_i2.p1 GENE.c11306_g2_i2~~c11306_g2_i2.p1  ORF type:complete len:222 (-),score=31.95 c11306_g2_i2:101-766(-)
MYDCRVSNFDFVEGISLVELSLQSLERGNQDTMAALERLLMRSTSISSLSLCDCVDWQRNDDDVSWIVKGLSHLTHLTQLDMRDNYLAPARVKEIALALYHLTNLTRLDFGMNELGSEGMEYLSRCLCCMPHLTQLRLPFNELGPEGAVFLGHSLAQLTQLSSLDLDWNLLGPRGMQSLLPHLTHFSHLTHLGLQKKQPQSRHKATNSMCSVTCRRSGSRQ